eukprot:8370362-Lingulodinium_polyedra.AAC.1
MRAGFVEHGDAFRRARLRHLPRLAAKGPRRSTRCSTSTAVGSARPRPIAAGCARSQLPSTSSN